MHWEIKYHPLAARVVYTLIENEKKQQMYILVISSRADNEVYNLSAKRK